MGLFDRIRGVMMDMGRGEAPGSVVADCPDGIVCSPATGESVEMGKLPDPVFSEGLMGPALGVRPEGDVVYAPISGIIRVAMPHAVGITSPTGLEVLVHIGVDTVALAGKGFSLLVKAGQSVRAGDPITVFDRDGVLAAGYDDTIITAITNADTFGNPRIMSSGRIVAGARMFSLGRRE